MLRIIANKLLHTHFNPQIIRSCSRLLDDDRPQQIDFDTLGTWDNRIDWPLLIQQSIKHGKPIPAISIVNAGHATLSGRRPTNEDRYRCVELQPNLLYLGIFDGHGGPACANFCSDHLEIIILSKLNKGEKDLQAILHASFLETNTAFAHYVSQNKELNTDNSGTTATVCLLRNSVELVIGHVGDSRALLCRNGVIRKLTVDHTDKVKQEQDRILNSGGIIKADSVGRGLVNGRLAMTRSLGDLELKPYGVISDPDTRSMEVKHGRDGFLVLTSDGINSVMTNEEIGKLIKSSPTPEEAATLITDLALQFGSEDNTTALVLPFGAWGKFKDPKDNSPLFGKDLMGSYRY